MFFDEFELFVKMKSDFQYFNQFWSTECPNQVISLYSYILRKLVWVKVYNVYLLVINIVNVFTFILILSNVLCTFYE